MPLSNCVHSVSAEMNRASRESDGQCQGYGTAMKFNLDIINIITAVVKVLE